jgi:hypothetical protein
MIAARIERFAVSPATANDPRHFDLCLHVGDLIGLARCENRGGYADHELPRFAPHFHELWTYRGEWENGGHAQYWGNIPDSFAWEFASDLLGHMGLTERRQLLDDFIALATREEERLIGLYAYERGAEADALFLPLDERYAEIERRSGALKDHLHRWLLAQPWVVIDPELSASDEIASAKVPPHPLREERKVALHRIRHAETGGEMRSFLARLRDRLAGGGRT